MADLSGACTDVCPCLFLPSVSGCGGTGHHNRAAAHPPTTHLLFRNRSPVAGSNGNGLAVIISFHMIKKQKSVYIIQTVGHALDVLEQFNGDVDELGFSELCRRLKFQKNKIFRLLATLEARNFIEQNKATTGYRLGLKNLQLGQTFFKQAGLIGHARPILESLTRRCDETSYV